MGLKIVSHQGYVKLQYGIDGDRTKLSTGVNIEKKEYLLSDTGQLSKLTNGYVNKQKMVENAWKKATHIRDQYYFKNLCYPSVQEFKDEWDNYDRRKKIGTTRSSDIWSLGCLLY